LIDQLAVAIYVFPDHILTDREALTTYLTEEMVDISCRRANAIEKNWQAAWEEKMAGTFVDVPNIQN